MRSTVVAALCGLGVLGFVAGREFQSPARPAVDEPAVRKTLADFTAAFEKGDVAAAAGFLTSGAELVPDGGPAVRGREAVQKAFAQHFGKAAKVKIDLAAEATHFPSRDTAVEEGRLTVTPAAGGKTTTLRYSVMLVREDGKWLIASIREWVGGASPLADLDWLIGTWVAKRADAEVQTTYDWFGDKTFIRAQFTVREKNRTYTGLQLIGFHPAAGEWRTWTFEHDGGIGEGAVYADGHRWVFEGVTFLSNGSVVETSNVLIPVDRDTITWLPVNLTVDGEQVGGLPPVKVTRVKAK